MTKLKDLRTNMGLTEEQVAERLQTTAEVVARWESKGGRIPLKQLRDLAIVLRCSVDELLEANTRSKKPRPSHEKDSLYGTLTLQLRGVEIEYPITQQVRANIECSVFEDASPPIWLRFETLNNKIVRVRIEDVLSLRFSSDEVEAAPAYYQREVYEALEAYVFDRLEQLGPAAIAECERICEECDEGWIRREVAALRAIFRGGKEGWYELQEERCIRGLEKLESARDSSLLQVTSEEYHEVGYVNLLHVSLLEIPAQRLERLLIADKR